MWIALSLISAVGTASRNTLSKYCIDKSNEYISLWFTSFFALIAGVPFILIDGFEIHDSEFWKLVIVRIFFDTIGIISLFRAFKLKSINYIVPLLALNPVLTSITSYFINDQKVTIAGVVGIVIIIFSTIIIFLSQIDFKQKTNNKELYKASIFVLIAISCWAIVDPIHKEAIEISTPYTYYFVGNAIFSIIFTILLLVFGKKDIGILKDKKLLILHTGLGFLLGVEFISQLLALGSGLTAYVSTVKATNIVIAPVLSWRLLNDKISLINGVGIILSLVGVLVLVLG